MVSWVFSLLVICAYWSSRLAGVLAIYTRNANVSSQPAPTNFPSPPEVFQHIRISCKEKFLRPVVISPAGCSDGADRTDQYGVYVDVNGIE